MSLDSFRFIHASDFHLDQPVGGITEVPEALRDRFIDAPYQAVERVFDLAVERKVDFVVLAGDSLHPPTSSPYTCNFLRSQFERLVKPDIPVYLLGGRLEKGQSWPTDLPLPDNVHRFPASRTKEFHVERNGERMAAIVGRSISDDHGFDAAEYRGQDDGHFRVAVAYGRPDAKSLRKKAVDYWAWGHKHNRGVLGPTACYSGSPQGRRPAEEGPHGCLLVEVDGMQPSSTFVETDTLQFRCEEVRAPDAGSRSDLESLLQDRLDRLRSEVTDRTILVTWRILGDGPVCRELRHGKLGHDLLRSLQKEAGSENNQIWSVEIQSEPATLPPELFEEDTILGDFLRSVRQLEQTDDEVLDLGQFLPQTEDALRLAKRLGLENPAERREVLRQVTTLGIDLLRGDQRSH